MNKKLFIAVLVSVMSCGLLQADYIPATRSAAVQQQQQRVTPQQQQQRVTPQQQQQQQQRVTPQQQQGSKAFFF